MSGQKSKKSHSGKEISVNVTSDDNLFEIICSDSKVPEKCEMFVERLKESSLNIKAKS